MMVRRMAGLAIACLVLSGAAPAQEVKKVGGVIVNGAGMTLYTFDRDAGGKSACNGPCAANWPPLKAAADAKPSGDWTIVTRDDGERQWAYKGRPVYQFSKDARPGDMTGDGFNNLWHAIKD